jgi:hypothetical protein
MKAYCIASPCMFIYFTPSIKILYKLNIIYFLISLCLKYIHTIILNIYLTMLIIFRLFVSLNFKHPRYYINNYIIFSDIL